MDNKLKEIFKGPIPDTKCAICLNEMTSNLGTTSQCVHLFCFECLKNWSNSCLQRCPYSEPTCPLCKEPFRQIYHSFTDQDGCELYTVPILNTLPSRPSTPIPIFPGRPFHDFLPHNRIWVLSMMYEDRGNDRLLNLLRVEYRRVGIDNSHNEEFDLHPSQNYIIQRPFEGQGWRIMVYLNGLRSQPLPDPSGRLRSCTSAFYRDNPLQMYRLYDFILREVVAIRESVRLEGQLMALPEDSDMNATTLIMRSLANNEIRQLHLLDDLRPFLNEHAVQFCHELYNFANSPYELSDYDRIVKYQYMHLLPRFTAQYYQEPPINFADETILLASTYAEAQRLLDEISRRDVEVQRLSFRLFDRLNPASIDQPSTSTGIRDSLDRPNNSFPDVHGGLSRVSYSSQVKRGRSNSDSSSDDDSSITDTQSSQTAHSKPRDVNNKKNRKHQ